MFLDEDCARRAPAEGLYTYRACSCIRVQKNRIFETRSENIKQRLAQSIRRRPQIASRKTLEPARAEFAADHAHALNACSTPRSISRSGVPDKFAIVIDVPLPISRPNRRKPAQEIARLFKLRVDDHLPRLVDIAAAIAHHNKCQTI